MKQTRGVETRLVLLDPEASLWKKFGRRHSARHCRRHDAGPLPVPRCLALVVLGLLGASETGVLDKEDDREGDGEGADVRVIRIHDRNLHASERLSSRCRSNLYGCNFVELPGVGDLGGVV